MDRFFSEENIDCHKQYVRDKRLKYSIIESSFPQLKGAKIEDIHRMRISQRDKRDAIDLLSEITLHEIYFSSFCECAYPRSGLVTDMYGNESVFLNFLYRECASLNYGFVCVYLYGKRIAVAKHSSCERALYSGTPVLAVDVCEHAYFTDYGFDKQRYLIQSLPYLNLAKLSVPDRSDGE